MDRPHFAYHSPKDEHLGCFYLMAIVTSAAVNRGVQRSF